MVGQFITLSPPFLSNIDKFGLLGGAVKNVGDLLNSNINTWSKGNAVTKWAFFIPNGPTLDTFADLAERDKVRASTFTSIAYQAYFKRLKQLKFILCFVPDSTCHSPNIQIQGASVSI